MSEDTTNGHEHVSAEVQALAKDLAIDLVGYASTSDLEQRLDARHRPSTLSPESRTLIVLGKRTLRGVLWAKHLPSKQLAGGRTLRALEFAAERIAFDLERRGALALPVSPASLDFEKRTPGDLLPAGQGSPLLREGAVLAGLGTLGLNRMVLTPEYGPRVFFAGVLTSAEIEPGAELDEELCLGLEECGRCAAICPADAIPRRASRGARLTETRGLDERACARSCQPFGFDAFSDHLASIFKARTGDEMWQRMRGRKSGEIWSEMAMMKEAALTGCSECVQVCPVGRDYERLSASTHRRHDLPDRLPRREADGLVEIENLGPQIRRRTTWEQERQ